MPKSFLTRSVSEGRVPLIVVPPNPGEFGDAGFPLEFFDKRKVN